MTQTLGTVFRWPLLIASVTLVGLISGLLGNEIWDALSWFTLGVPALWAGSQCLKSWIGRGRHTS